MFNKECLGQTPYVLPGHLDLFNILHAGGDVTLAQSLNHSLTIVEIYISIGCFALKDVTDIINDRCSLCCLVTGSIQVVDIQIVTMELDACMSRMCLFTKML